MTKLMSLAGGIKMAAGIALLGALTGCVGYVGGGYDGGGTLVVGEPLFGGFDRGRDVHAYSHRGSESRAVAHGGGGRGGRH